MRTYVRASLMSAAAVLVLVAAAGTGAFTGVNTRVSVDSAGNEANDVSERLAISADGRYVAFASRASNLVPGDTNGNWDIFLHDHQTGATTRISLDSAGDQGNGDSRWLAVSADARYVAFASSASDLVPSDTNGESDVFVHDCNTGATERVSVDSAGSQGSGASGDPAISAEGRYVAFASLASDLVPGDSNGRSDIFVHDRQTGATTRVSVDNASDQANDNSHRPTASGDGRYVAFASFASDLVPGDTNNSCDTDFNGTYTENCPDIFVHDRDADNNGIFDEPGGISTERVSVDTAGNEGDGWSYYLIAIAGDGRYIAFQSLASNLVPGDSNGRWDVFAHDRQTGVTERVSVDRAGNQGDDDSHWPTMSADGRYVAFDSQASNLVTGDANSQQDVFVHDRQTGVTDRVSVDSAGSEGNDDSGLPTVSANGRYVAFASLASNLVPGDSNGTQDIFVHDTGPVGPVGGMAELPDVAQSPNSSARTYITLAGAAAAALAPLTAGAWYARRRWLR